MSQTVCTQPSPSTGSIADPNYIVVPTGGCWARADFAEIINRTIITKSIVAVDCSEETGTSLSQAIVAGAQGAKSTGGTSNDVLSGLLDKLVSCIINNNGIISPTDPIVIAYVIDANTQLVVATSTPPSSLVPVDPRQKFDVVENNGNNDTIIVYEKLLADPSSWYEFVAPDTFDPTFSTFSYRFVSYASEYYRLVIQVRLTPIPVLYPCSVIVPEQEVDACCGDEDCNSGAFEDVWKLCL
jgi:hypothetical protein